MDKELIKKVVHEVVVKQNEEFDSLHDGVFELALINQVDLERFATAFLQELTKRSEPVGEISADFKSGRMIADFGCYTTRRYLEGTKIFTFPPAQESQEALMQKVAEACAMTASQHNDYYGNCREIASKIRAGKWKEYLK